MEEEYRGPMLHRERKGLMMMMMMISGIKFLYERRLLETIVSASVLKY
jgi:hypothetical protein